VGFLLHGECRRLTSEHSASTHAGGNPISDIIAGEQGTFAVVRVSPLPLRQPRHRPVTLQHSFTTRPRQRLGLVCPRLGEFLLLVRAENQETSPYGDNLKYLAVTRGCPPSIVKALANWLLR
jgi:hypothetical protein